MKNIGYDNKIYMFQREPRKWRTQEQSPAPLFQSILVNREAGQWLSLGEGQCEARGHYL